MIVLQGQIQKIMCSVIVLQGNSGKSPKRSQDYYSDITFNHLSLIVIVWVIFDLVVLVHVVSVNERQIH